MTHLKLPLRKVMHGSLVKEAFVNCIGKCGLKDWRQKIRPDAETHSPLAHRIGTGWLGEGDGS